MNDMKQCTYLIQTVDADIFATQQSWNLLNITCEKGMAILFVQLCSTSHIYNFENKYINTIHTTESQQPLPLCGWVAVVHRARKCHDWIWIWWHPAMTIPLGNSLSPWERHLSQCACLGAWFYTHTARLMDFDLLDGNGLILLVG